MSKRYAVRKIDTEDPFFYVVDLSVPGAVLISKEAIVEFFRDSRKAHKLADELNSRGGS